MNLIELDKIKVEVWQFIQELNKTWIEDHEPEKLKEYFHKNMIALNPMDKLRVEGGENCVQGWVDFVKSAEIHYWKEREPKIEIYNDGKVAVVTYYYDMFYNMNNRTIKSEGRDLFFLIKEENRWWVVADEFSEIPK